MTTSRPPEKTLADYLVIGVSPVLIMVLVGSLVFFLIEVFYRGDQSVGIRWVLFWFVVAVVAVARIGIEQGRAHAAIYGLALGCATWLYLTHTHAAPLLGLILLAVVWWSASQLTWDCTLIDDTQDASGHGLLTVATRTHPVDPESIDSPLTTPGVSTATSPPRRLILNRKAKKPHPPGLWVVYFSGAALPLFGLGQVLLPREDLASRQWGFAFLCAYLAAALGLLVTTSFLGLRRYLRQRRLVMPLTITFGWVRSGAGIIGLVLFLALLGPRPGADYSAMNLAHDIDSVLGQASTFANPHNPPGQGPGAPGRMAGDAGRTEKDLNGGGRSETQSAETSGSANGPQPGTTAPQVPSGPTPVAVAPANSLHQLLRFGVIVLGVVALLWWLTRSWAASIGIARALMRAVAEFWRRLFAGGPGARSKTPATPGRAARPAQRSFAAFPNPFLTGRDRTLSTAQLALLTFEAVQAWARDRRVVLVGGETPREFCRTLGAQFPDLAPGLDRVAYLYAHAAYGRAMPSHPDLEPVRQLWQYLSATSGARH
jgi:hypothetical protein